MSSKLIYPVLAICALIFVLACGSGDTSESDNGEVAAANTEHPGKKVYNMYCIVCHGSDGTMGANGAHNLQESTLTLDERLQVITKGRNTMTAFEKVISEEKIKQVAEYIETFRS